MERKLALFSPLSLSLYPGQAKPGLLELKSHFIHQFHSAYSTTAFASASAAATAFIIIISFISFPPKEMKRRKENERKSERPSGLGTPSFHFILLAPSFFRSLAHFSLLFRSFVRSFIIAILDLKRTKREFSLLQSLVRSFGSFVLSQYCYSLASKYICKENLAAIKSNRNDAS